MAVCETNRDRKERARIAYFPHLPLPLPLPPPACLSCRSFFFPSLQLVLDRREDPVTPLLSQWTYQAMVHELLPKGISNNLVDLRGVPGVSSKELQEVVLSPSSDEFFRLNMFSNYGDLGGAVRKLLDDYSRSRGSHESE